MSLNKKKTPPTRYCIVGDDSGHDYSIPEDKKDEWFAWAYGEESEYDIPRYATRIDGRFTFTDPRCD